MGLKFVLVPEAREILAGGATTGPTRFPIVEKGSALEGREKQPRTGDVPPADASRAPTGAPPERTVGMRYKPVVSPPANISRPSRTPCCGALGRGCSCRVYNDLFKGSFIVHQKSALSVRRCSAVHLFELANSYWEEDPRQFFYRGELAHTASAHHLWYQVE